MTGLEWLKGVRQQVLGNVNILQNELRFLNDAVQHSRKGEYLDRLLLDRQQTIKREIWRNMDMYEFFHRDIEAFGPVLKKKRDAA